MRRLILLEMLLVFLFHDAYSQPKPSYTPRIEPCSCPVQPDSSLKARCAYLVVPQNRNKPTGATIKLPFIYLESQQANKKTDPVLYTAGGPGASSLGTVRYMNEASLQGRDFIAFEQRGTRYALPCLSCPEVPAAIKRAYQHSLSKDSLVQLAVKRCRTRLVSQGIDLSAYNTVESAADIEDLRRALRIDSLNLMGISYSGGLMLTVLRNFPAHIRSLVLDSPLPGFVHYDEEGLLNIYQALGQVFTKCQADSACQSKYGNLRQRFEQYFSSIGEKRFSHNYARKGTTDIIRIAYGRDELLEVITEKLSDHGSLAGIPSLIDQLIKGQHAAHLTEIFDNLFAPNPASGLGMRYSVWCSEQMAFEKAQQLNRQHELLPFLKGYPFNNVNQAICSCWQVTPLPQEVKKPVYSNKPVLLGAGDTDPWCSPFYNDLLHHYLPNSQRLLFVNRTHTPMLSREGFEYIHKFLNNPYAELKSDSNSIRIY